MKLPKRFALSAFMLLMLLVALVFGYVQMQLVAKPVAQVTTADVRNVFTERSSSLNDLVAMLREDEQVVDIDKYGAIQQRVSLGRREQYLKVLRKINIPVYTILCDRKEDQLTVNVFVDGWSDKKRLVYTTGARPKELVMLCMECPTQSFEPLENGWFIGIIDDSTKDSDTAEDSQ